MSTYSLTVAVDQKWVKQFNANNTKLCFATAVTSAKESYNVVASAKGISHDDALGKAFTDEIQVVASTVTFTWTEEYGIAASHDEFQHGGECVSCSSGWLY